MEQQQQQTRKIKREEEEERQPMSSGNAAVPPPTSSTSVELRSDLADFLSFSSADRWRFISANSATSLTSFAPLLLLPYYKTLKTLTLKTFPCKFPPIALTLPSCLGYSNGYLIFLNGGNPLLVNVFTGKFTFIRSPIPVAFLGFRLAFLTPSSNLLLLDWNSLLLSYSPVTDSWSFLDLRHRITSISMFQGHVFGLDAFTRLILLELHGETIGWRRMSEMPLLPLRYCRPCSTLGQSLVECGEMLLMLRFIIVTPFPCMRSTQMLEVYRMDFEKAAWVEVDNIGDWCLFVDAVGACPLACPNPARWGGKSNCVYIAGPGCDEGWEVVQLDGSRRVRFGSEAVFSEELNLKRPRWPSPIWVFPSMLSYYN